MRFTQEQIDQAKQVPVERIAKIRRIYSSQERKIFFTGRDGFFND